MFILLALLVFGAMSMTVHAQGNSYYVARKGNNNNPGTEARPFKTIARGLQALQPGDTLYNMKGTYKEEMRNNIPSGESWSRPVTVRAYPGHRVIIKPKRGAHRPISFTGNMHHIIIEGLILDATNCLYEVIKIGGVDDPNQPSPHHIRIINNEIRNAGKRVKPRGQYKYFTAGIFTTGNAPGIEYIGNRIHHNGVTDYDHGIYHRSSHGLIEGNVIYNNKGSGIKVGCGAEAVNNIVRNNRVFDNNTAKGARGKKKQGRGIGVYSGSGTLVYNNVVWGAHHSGIDVTYGGNNARVFNNTVSINRGWGIIVGLGQGDQPTSANTIVRNNIVYQQRADKAAIHDFRGINTIIENNLTFGRNTDVSRSSGSSATIRNNLVGVNPQFLNLGSNNFLLASNSPAIDAGIALSEVPNDYNGVPRPQGRGHDIGAFEYRG